jgi:ATP-dependent Zn protease
MATAEPIGSGLRSRQESNSLATQWRQLTRAATAVALLTSPAAFVYFHSSMGLSMGWALLATFGLVVAFRGFVDLGLRRLIPWPSLFGTDDAGLREEDVVSRRRAWYWHKKFRLVVIVLLVITAVFVVRLLKAQPGEAVSWPDTAGDIIGGIGHFIASPALAQFLILPLFFLLNFVILFGPLMMVGVTQIRGYEPGDAEWGVKLEDVRGQAEAKEEVRRVVSLWQSGEAFEKAGGKRERGLLFLGAPGTGKTMLAKAIATGFNSPFVSIPGSGFAQTFIGMDAVIVRYLAWKAKRLAAKWGGQCIVFIDEIDAVGMRRASLGGGGVGTMTAGTSNFEDFCFYGPNGSLTPSGDLVLETRAWRDRLFTEREPKRAAPAGFLARVGAIVNQAFPGMYGGMGGGLAINQLLVVMDGIDNPPFTKRVLTNRINTFLDASYVIPRRIGRVRLRARPPRPRNEQIYFIGATNVPIEALDPALTRPGRMGRHVWFRTPTKNDRLDIFDLYLGKVDHEPDLDTPVRREELARITNGYSPAFIEQVTSMALTYAHHDGRERFGWYDIVEAMTTVESGTAVNIDYVPEETRAVAIHEAGHAVAAHAYMKGSESTRLSIRRRGSALGHHMALEKEERFSSWRSEEMSRLIWTLGAMAAERAFYGENSTGVGGDVQSATARAAWMVGACAMGPEHVELNGNGKVDGRGKRNGKLTAESQEELRELILKRFERLGSQIMNTTGGGGPFSHDPIGSVLSSREQRAMVAQMLGQAYMAAYHLIANNREAVERLADEVAARKELYGNELLQILEDSKLKVPEVDLQEEAAWPKM